MFCKECGIKNSDDAFKCINCGTYLKSSDSPLDGTERVKVALYFVLVCISNIFGIIPLLISLAAIYIMKKDKSFDAIKNFRKFIYGYLISFVIFFLSVADLRGEEVAIIFVASLIFIWAENYLFYEPLEAHQDWIIKHGIFSDKPNEKSIIKSMKEAFQKPQSCSIADELLKWKALLDQGVITEEEFNQRRDSLLK